MKYELKVRAGSEGKKVVSPFINGWNVWDIPMSQWTDEIDEAIKHAYKLGVNHAIKEIKVEIADKVKEKLAGK